jgi:hypothetical protein
MPFNQSGSNATAKIGTYNDVAGNQTNDYSKVVGDIGNAIHPCVATQQLILLLKMRAIKRRVVTVLLVEEAVALVLQEAPGV